MNETTVELLLDNEKISWEHNVERQLCQPVKHPNNPLLTAEHPWEESFLTLAGAKGSRADQPLCYAEVELCDFEGTPGGSR